MTIDSIQKKILRQTAHHLNPTVWVGKNGITENVIKDVQKALDSVFFNKGLAKKYFNGPADFKDLADMKLKLTIYSLCIIIY